MLNHFSDVLRYSRAQLLISKSGGEFQFSILKQSRWDVFKALFKRSTRAERETVQNLKELLGAKRLERIFLRRDLSLNPKRLRSHQLRLTKEIVHKLLVGLSDIRLDDLEEKAAAQSLDLKTLNTAQMDQLYGNLLPNLKLKSICRPVSFLDCAVTSGKGFKGLQERVWTIQKARKRAIKNSQPQKHAQIAEIEMLSSRLADREPPQGSIVRLKDAYFVVDRAIERGGACLRLFRELSPQPRTLLVCRGMAARTSASGALLSILNGIVKKIGLFGIGKSWAELRQYLIEKRVQQIDILGKSLGGGHAQYLTALILNQTSVEVRSLSTYCSIGTPAKVQKLFDSAIKKGKRKPNIAIVRNRDDYIPLVGGTHLHTADTTKLYYVAKTPLTFSALMPKGQGFSKTIARLFHSFGAPHMQQNTLRKQFYICEPVHLTQELYSGNRLETFRYRAAQVINLATFGLLNPLWIKIVT
ncbi:MAG: hypothetical protein LLG04_12260 [Parachlamydia sp.]|nr:hypothetical protein [Parachlamydia sp.]